jgi:hypothetical protein
MRKEKQEINLRLLVNCGFDHIDFYHAHNQSKNFMGLSVIEFYKTRKINLEYFSYILNQTAAFTIQIFTKTNNCSTKLLDQIQYQIYRNRQRSIESRDRYPIRSQNNIGRHWANFHETRPSLTKRCKLCYTKFHGHQTNYSVAHTMSRTERRTDRRGLHVRCF